VLIAFVTVAALLAGLAGAWSPCGLSMVETLAAGSRAVVALGSFAFALGALAGAVVTFGGLALAGQALGLGGGVVTALAAAALLAAAAGDAAGRRLVPQIRRQVPESWRRVLPVPVAAALYGVLLGLGFTTFVLSFATYGLALACAALGDPAVGIAAGLAFGAGRALPVIALAPLPHAAAAMAERPDVLRGLRGAAATALAAAALVLALDGAPAHAQASVYAAVGADPSAISGAIAYEDAQGRGVLDRGGRIDVLPGSDPAVGSDAIAWYEPGAIVIADPSTLEPRVRIPATGVDAIALSPRFVAWRAVGPDGLDRLVALDRTVPGAPARELLTATTASGALGPPALEDTRMVFHFNGRSQSRILEIDLTTDAQRQLKVSRGALLLNPSLSGGAMAYVRSSATRQQLRIVTPYGGDRIVYSTTPTARRDAGVESGRHQHLAGYRDGRPPAAARPTAGVVRTLWTTTMTPANVYLTVLRSVRGGPPTAGILRVPRAATR
jgi:hypothetical protein